MGFIGLIFPWGLLLQALALVHFVRRRPDTFWLWIIVFLGPLGAAVYIAMEVVPDLGLLRQSYDGLGRRKRITQLEAVVQENPAVGNFEELADLYLDEGEYAKARACYDRRSPAEPITPIRSTGAASPKSSSARSRTPSGISRSSQAATRSTISTAPPVCWRTPTRTPASPSAPMRCSARSRRFRRVRNLLQLRRVPGRAGPHRRRPRMGAEDSVEEADDAPVSPAPGTALVPQGKRAAEPASGLTALPPRLSSLFVPRHECRQMSSEFASGLFLLMMRLNDRISRI